MTERYQLNRISQGRDKKYNDPESYRVPAEALLRYSGKVYRRDQFICMATYIGDGFWLTTWDTVEDRSYATSWVYHDLKIVSKPFAGDLDIRENVEWVVQLPHKPLLLMKTEPGPKRQPDSHPLYGPGAVEVAPLFDLLAETPFRYLWRIGYISDVHNLKSIPDDELPYVTPGYTAGDMFHSWYRSGSDEIADAKTTINVHCCFDYPHKPDLGSPVVLQDGRLAAILVSGGLGPQYSHQGAIIPLELVKPTVRLWSMRHDHEKNFSSRSHVTFVPQFDE